jgi:ribonuclease HI
VEQARGRWRCRSAHLRPLFDAYETAVTRMSRVRLKQVPRSKNLAGIALSRRGAGQPVPYETTRPPFTPIVCPVT